MANPNFIPDYSTNQIYRNLNQDRCLTDDLDDMDDAIEALENGKADSAHTHSGYAPATHGHTDYAPVSHEHSGYANSDHTHTGFADENHEHAEYADADHTHTGYAATNHTHTGYAASSHTHSEYAAASHEHTDYAPVSHEHTGYASTDHTHTGFAAESHTHTAFPADSSAASYKIVYISTTGNDENDGFTQANAMATIKGVVKKYADAFKALDIRLLDGTYNEDTWAISVDQCNLSIRSASENKDACILNITGNIESNVNKLRLYNMTINATATNVRVLSVTAGSVYAYNMRFSVPEASDASCVNVYNGSSAFLMNCVLNAGTTSNAGAAVYGNQAMLIKAINCTSERTNALGFHAHNGTDIWYTDTLTATTKTKVTSWGKCTVR